MIKKSFFYDFIPSKAEEDDINALWEVPRALVEVHDVFPPPVLDPSNPWKIKKSLTQYEVINERLEISFTKAFEHIFRYWALLFVSEVVMGQVMDVVVWDLMNENNPRGYRASFETLPDDDYILECTALFNDRNLEFDDEIGLYWDYQNTAFHFKLLHKAVVVQRFPFEN